jgi:hypothetical protein
MTAPCPSRNYFPGLVVVVPVTATASFTRPPADAATLVDVIRRIVSTKASVPPVVDASGGLAPVPSTPRGILAKVAA